MIIERFEGLIAVIEDDDGTYFEIEKCKLPDGTKEGDYIYKFGDDYKIDDNKTDEIRKNIINLQNSLWN
ncbi:MAG: DUF3006 domain-containing protein [Oscillospiraceae bacterium]